MKKFLILPFLIALLALHSCDKVNNPVVIQTTLDTTLYPGNFADYVEPTFSPNTNTLKNVLLEDYTGHKCTFCPTAAIEAAAIEAANPGRVFVVSIHAGAANSGVSDFQHHFPDESKYFTDHTTVEGREIGGTFFQSGVGFNSNPQGTINRVNISGQIFTNAGNWGAWTNNQLDSVLRVNIQAESNYFPETNGVFIHTETEFLEDMNGEYNIVIYAIDDVRIDWQLDAGVDVPDYHHHHVHMGNVYNETWGRSVASGSIEAGTKVYQEFSYKVPDGMTNEDMHFIIYVYDKATYEVLQVIKEEF